MTQHLGILAQAALAVAAPLGSVGDVHEHAVAEIPPVFPEVFLNPKQDLEAETLGRDFRLADLVQCFEQCLEQCCGNALGAPESSTSKSSNSKSTSRDCAGLPAGHRACARGSRGETDRAASSGSRSI